MYHHTLNIGLFGIEDEVADALRMVEAPANFSFEFVAYPTVDDESLTACNIAIVDIAASKASNIGHMHEMVHAGKVGYHALVIVAPQEATEAWTAEDLANVDAIWPAPLQSARAVFEFQRVAQYAKQRADALMTNVYLDTLIDSMPEMVWFKRLDGAHMRVNSYFCDIVGKTREDIVGQHHNYIWNVPKEDQDKAELTCKVSEDAAIESGSTCMLEENVSTHGHIRLFATYKTPIYDEDGTVLGTSGFAHDVTHEREVEHLAWLNARTDYLTGTYNRRYFSEYMAEHVNEGPYILVMVDLDDFKEVNDSKGHAAGDSVLRIVTELMRFAYADCPIIRWGGDEFIIIIPNDKDYLASEERFDKLVEDIKQRTLSEVGLSISASGGITRDVAPRDADSAVLKADKALYRAKATGKSRLIVSEE